ncbi:MAG: Zn-dependent hydrolase [candidate division Zixibacteria bacterium]|nr:Zn-dependent hydrolase [candidate division Zixibacteria bacterium]
MSFLKINFDRLKNDLHDLAEIGQIKDQGIFRMGFSDFDMQARDWLECRLIEAGLVAYRDGAANVFGGMRENEQRPLLLFGSHLDSVPGGGNLDGGLGVIAALECLRRIKEEGLETRYGPTMVAFSDEEGRFGGPLGSQAISGDINPEIINTAVDLNGIMLKDELLRQGMDARDILHARRTPESIHAFLELHIEQGPVLDRAGENAAAVDIITGLCKWLVRLIGEADHAGTTPMNMRRDAFQGLSEFAGEIPRILEEIGSDDSVATIGKVDLYPGSANTIPSLVEFSFDFRDPDSTVLVELANAFRKALSAIARRRELMFEFSVISEIAPVSCDRNLVDTISRTAQHMGIKWRTMHSGAAHDAQILSRIAPVGMIFVPSKDGRSHCPAEWTHWKDIEIGGNLLLNSIIQVAEVVS